VAQIVGLPKCSIAPAQQAVCEGLTATFTASSTGPSQGAPHTFSWVGPGNFTATGASITVGVAGIYTATIIDQFGCTSTCTAALIINPNPQCAIAPETAEVCAGGSATFTANVSGGTAPFAITWTGPGTFTATGPSISATVAGVYTATVIDSRGCSTSCQSTLNVNPIPSCVVAPASQEVCQGSTATFTVNVTGGTAPFTIEWTGPGNFSGSGPNIVAGVAGTYTANVTDSKGCVTSCSAQLIVNPVPACVIAPSTQEICLGAEATFTVSVTSGTPPFSIEWTGPSGFTATGPTITISDAVLEDSGSYVANVTDSKGCPTTCSAQLNVIPCGEEEIACRVTGGGVLVPGTVSLSCIPVETTLFPATTPNGLNIVKSTFGLQFGAPLAQHDCGEVLNNKCIRGTFSLVRHFGGTANPRDVFEVRTHGVQPKGVFDGLTCLCAGCCVDGVFIDPLVVNDICNPTNKICGPLPAPAPANMILVSGLATLTPEDDARGNRADKTEYVVFRMFLVDHSQPGGVKPGGAEEPASILCLQFWKTGIKQSRKPDFSVVAPDFRRAVAAANCAFLESLKNGIIPIGSLPDPEVAGVMASAQDCGPLSTGAIQLHKVTGAKCTE
jgi:PKD repeat protein